MDEILKLEEQLEKVAGITFDTGTDFKYRDWEFDWSLKGRNSTKIIKNKD
jgi:hypothetical protein